MTSVATGPATELATAEQELLTRWSNACGELEPQFVFDGIPDPGAYLSAPVKLLILLKEPHREEFDGSRWDFRRAVREHWLKERRTWDNGARWARALTEMPGPPEWSSVQVQSTESRCAALQAVAMVNLKKIPGGAVAVEHKVRAFARAHRAFLLEQLRLYKPDVTLLCGTATYLPEFLPNEEQGAWRVTSSGVTFCRNDLLGIAIKFCHPQRRGRRAEELYRDLATAVSEIRSGRDPDASSRIS